MIIVMAGPVNAGLLFCRVGVGEPTGTTPSLGGLLARVAGGHQGGSGGVASLAPSRRQGGGMGWYSEP